MEEELLEQFKRKYPTKRIVFLNQRDNKYGGEYLSFNLEIFALSLKDTSLSYEIRPDCVCINGGKELFCKLLFDCATVCEYDEDRSEILLYPYVTATDAMRVCCAILKIFDKNA